MPKRKKRVAEITIKTLAGTIDHLARMTQEGFADVGKRLTGVEGRLTGVEDRLINMDGRLTAVERRIDAMERRFDAKLDKLTTTLDAFLKRLTDHEDEFELMKRDVKRMKSVLKEKLGVTID